MKTYKEFINESKLKLSPALLKKIKADIEKHFTIYEEDINDDYAEFLPSTSRANNKHDAIVKFSEEMNKKYKDEGVEFSAGEYYYVSGSTKSRLPSIYVELVAPPKPVKKETPLTQKQKDDIIRKEKEMENKNDAARKRNKGEY